MTPTDTVVSEERLRECPFCGGPAELDNAAEPQFARRPTVTCKDEDCFGYMPSAFFARDADAIAAWNRRTATPQSGGVVVKGLEWEGDRSKSVVGTYATVRTPDGYAVTFDGEEIAHIGHNSVSAFEGARNAAQSHAQADYEARILSTLADPIPEAPADEEDPRWQKLRDLFGLDGWYDGVWQGVANPDQIVTHIEHVARERARLLALRRSTETDKPGVREAAGRR